MQKSLKDWRKEPARGVRRRKSKPLEYCYVHLGKVVSEMRRIHGLSQKQLGDLLGIESSTVSRIESGSMRWPVSEYPKIALVLKIDLADLFPEDFGLVQRTRKAS